MLSPSCERRWSQPTVLIDVSISQLSNPHTGGMASAAARKSCRDSTWVAGVKARRKQQAAEGTPRADDHRHPQPFYASVHRHFSAIQVGSIQHQIANIKRKNAAACYLYRARLMPYSARILHLIVFQAPTRCLSRHPICSSVTRAHTAAMTSCRIHGDHKDQPDHANTNDEAQHQT